jgi:uncharacterized protein (DUF427 family)
VPKAMLKNAVRAESDDTIVLEGNHYFPTSPLNSEGFKASSQSTHCFWRGEASYDDVAVEGEVNPGAAWYYPDPKERAARIKDHVSFWTGVHVES